MIFKSFDSQILSDSTWCMNVNIMCVQEQCMQEEILSLKLRMSEQEEVLKGTIQRLRSTSRTKESMEHFIVNQRECFCIRLSE